MEFEGEFESHITIRSEGPSRVDALRAWASDQKLKFHQILLDRGLTPLQPMVGQRGRGVLSGELAKTENLCRRLAANGFLVTRVKIEAAPGNREVPDSDAEAVRFHSGRYFEHHVKLALSPEVDMNSLTSLAQNHAAHLSRNALRVRPDGLSERFVTQRCYEVGRATAKARLHALLTSLAEGGYPILNVEEEFVVHDSDPSVDAGWLDNEGISCPNHRPNPPIA